MGTEKPAWRDDLDRLLGAIEALDTSMIAVSKPEADEVAIVLRGANRRIWNYINQLEAHRAEYYYDLHQMMRDVAKANDLAVGQIWVELAEQGAFKVNAQTLVKAAGNYGIDPTKYMSEKEKHDDGTD